MKRKLSLILAILSAAQLVACGGDSVSTDTTAAETTSESTSAPETELSDDLPETDFEGETFTILTYITIGTDLYSESLTGDVINDAVFERNQAVEERFNVEIEVLGHDKKYEDVSAAISSSVLAGDDDYQLISSHVVAMGGLVVQELFMNWYDIPHVNFEKPWWSKSTREHLTYKGDTCILAIGDLAMSAMSASYCVFFDKPAAADYKLENLYTVVNEGRWTLDYMRETVKDVYKDLNGDGERDLEDFYGLVQATSSPVNAYLWAFGGKIFEQNKDGVPEYVFSGEQTVDIYSKLWQLCKETEGVYDINDWQAKNYNFNFIDGNCIFLPAPLSHSISEFREKKNEYGIIPYPKFDEKQEDYMTMADGYHAVLAVPKTVQNTEMVGIITEALNAETHKSVYPKYYEIALKTKYTSDSESGQMIDIIVENRVFDFGYVYDNWKGVSFFFEKMFGSDTEEFASYYAANSSAALAHYDSIIAYYESLK